MRNAWRNARNKQGGYVEPVPDKKDPARRNRLLRIAAFPENAARPADGRLCSYHVQGSETETQDKDQYAEQAQRHASGRQGFLAEHGRMVDLHQKDEQQAP